MRRKMRASPHCELVSPAGDWESLRAAVANGADAVYFGLIGSSARQRAANFAVSALPEVVKYLHDRNVRGYVALNILTFSDELPQAVETVRAIAQSGADAVIVQDVGLAVLVHRISPDLPIHASTQMSITDARGIVFAQRLGIKRVILARELTISEIEMIAGDHPGVELETFVHGALCISYSGQCLASEVLGGRSANRGFCAQACRLPYQLISEMWNGECGLRNIPHSAIRTPNSSYLLSPHDLAAYDAIPKLIDAGVHAFKIEGRLKSAPYVALATRVYRDAIDAAMAGMAWSPTPQVKLEMEQIFSRGFTHGYLDGVNHGALVDGGSPKSRGVRIGRVVSKKLRSLVIALEHPTANLKAGDGIAFEQQGDEQAGGRVFEVKPARNGIEILMGRSFDIAGVRAGADVWKTDDPELRRRLEQSYAKDTLARTAPVTAVIAAAVGEPLRVSLRDDAGHEVSVSSDDPLPRAEKHPLSLELLRKQLGRLGGTPFHLADVKATKLEPVMAPMSLLNDVRRKAVEGLLRLRAAAARYAVVEPNALEKMRREIAARGEGEAIGDRLYVLVRTMPHLEAVIGWSATAALKPSLIYCDLRETQLHPAAGGAAQRCRDGGIPFGLGTLRVTMPGEDRLLEEIAALKPGAILVRSLSALEFFKERTPEIPLVGDFSLNVANEISADLFVKQGLTRIAPSYDLNWRQLNDMAGRISPALFEVVIHQHMPMFHMRYCPLTPAGACDRLCDKVKAELRDRMGVHHPIETDAGCRVTVFNSVAQSACEYVEEMKGRGMRHFRIELLRETRQEVSALLSCYQDLLLGKEGGNAVWGRLQKVTRGGLTRGTLRRS